jgi:hypothetical protein
MTTDAPAHFNMLADGHAIYIAPLRIETMMSGVLRATQDKQGMVTLHYEDGTTESRQSAKTISDENAFDHFFAIVSFVQAGRGKTP